MNTAYIVGDESLLQQLSGTQRNNKYWTLVYIRHDRGMFIIDDDLRSLNEGDILMIPPRVNFSFCSRDLGDEYNVNLSAVVLRFDNFWLDAFLRVFPVCANLVLSIKETKDIYVFRGPKWIRMSALLDELISCKKNEQPKHIFTILELISNKEDMVLVKNLTPEHDLTYKKDRIDRYIECNYCNKISLEVISDYVGMSRIYFCNFFKSQYGEGFSDYLNRLRVEKASLLLINTDMTLEHIAHECGFKTVQYFTRSFGKIRQVTPAAFRKSNKK